MIWREALAYAPSLLALSLLLSSAGFRLAPAGHSAGSERPWYAAALVLCALGVALSLHSAGALILGLSGMVASCGALLWDVPRGSAAPAATSLGEGAQRGTGTAPWLLVEAGALLVASPVLLLPTLRPALTGAAIVLVALSWLLGAILHRRQPRAPGEAEALWPRSAYDPALVLLVITVAIAIWIAARQGSDARTLMLPKACSLLLGLAVFRLSLRYAQSSRQGALGSRPGSQLAVLVAATLTVGLLFGTLGLLGGLRYTRVPGLGELLSRLPRLVDAIPETQGGRVSLNQLGGMLLLVLPLAAAVGLAPRAAGVPGWLRVLALSATGVFAVALGLAQSRGAWAGAVACALVFVALRGPWGRGIVAAVLVVVSVLWIGWGRDVLGSQIVAAITAPGGTPTAVGSVGLHGRIPVWTDALVRIGAAPWIGNGLGTYRLGGAAFKGASTPFDAGLPHAHNVALQVAYDLGLPGLVAYCALVVTALRQAFRLRREASGIGAAVAVGCVSALTGYHVYGITDTLALGSKPGLLLWLLLGLLGAAVTTHMAVRNSSIEPVSSNETLIRQPDRDQAHPASG